MDRAIEKLLVQCATLPSLPAVAVELLAECRKDDVNLDRICDLLGQDPALATKVLSVANSSMYRRGTPITTVRRATVALGANAVTALALSFSLMKHVGQGPFDFHRFWRRALLAAVAAHELAKWARVDPEESLLAGLLQDVGVLALQTALPDYEAIVRESEGDHERLARLERERLGVTHMEVGAWLATRLRLPEALVRAIVGSHGPSLEDGSNQLERCVAVAGAIAEIWVQDAPATATRRAAEAAAAWLSLEPAAFDSLLAQISMAAERFAPLFDVRLPKAETMQDILQQARDALRYVDKGVVELRAVSNAPTRSGETKSRKPL